MSECYAVQYSDQMVCERCRQSWDVNDVCVPVCNPVADHATLRDQFATDASPAVYTDMSDHDDVNNPKHYDLFPNQQVIDVIQASLTEEEFTGYCKGNALKYRLRAGDKGDALKCIAKANWYQNKLRGIKK